MVSSRLLRRVALVRTDVSEEPGASFIRVTKISELGTTQAATSNKRTLRTSVASCKFLSPWWRRRQVPPKRRFLQQTHGVTTQKTPFFISCTVFVSLWADLLHFFVCFFTVVILFDVYLYVCDLAFCVVLSQWYWHRVRAYLQFEINLNLYTRILHQTREYPFSFNIQ
jgi:hypothetical protein